MEAIKCENKDKRTVFSLEGWAVLLNWMYQYFSCSIRKEICSLRTYLRLCQTMIAYFEKKNMAAEPLLRSWRAKLSIDPSGSEDTVTSPLHLSVILSASNDLAVRSGKSLRAWRFFVSSVQLFATSVSAQYFNPVCYVRLCISTSDETNVKW